MEQRKYRMRWGNDYRFALDTEEKFSIWKGNACLLVCSTKNGGFSDIRVRSLESIDCMGLLTGLSCMIAVPLGKLLSDVKEFNTETDLSLVQDNPD